jgi:hypothetical protein
MFKMAVGQSDDVDPIRAVDATIAECRAQLDGLAPRAGLLFAALDSFDPRLVGRVRDAFGAIDVIGATSAAEMSSIGGYQEDSVALALFASDNIEFGVGLGDAIDQDAPAAAKAAAAQALAPISQEPKICVVLAEGANTQRAIESLRGELPAGVLMIGGAAGGNELRGTAGTFQVCNDLVSNSGIAIMLMAGPLSFSTAVGMGWRILGPQGVVTASDYGVIKTIDGRPAADWLSGYLDPNTAATSGNPLAIKDAGSDDWYLRVALSTDEAGGLFIPGSVPEGATVQLTTTNPDDMLEATQAAVERARAAFPLPNEPTAALIFSCAVRKYVLGTRARGEVEAARTILPLSLPIAGMYCMGEVAPTGDEQRSHFLNETFVTLLLGS